MEGLKRIVFITNMITKAQRCTTITIERIELCEGTMCQNHLSTHKGSTVHQRIRELRVISNNLTVYRF